MSFMKCRICEREYRVIDLWSVWGVGYMCTSCTVNLWLRLTEIVTKQIAESMLKKEDKRK